MSNGPYPWDEDEECEGEESAHDHEGVREPLDKGVSVVFHRLNKGVVFPRRMTDGAAGWDLVGTSARRFGKGWTEMSTGIAVTLPAGYVGLIRGRSGLAFKHGITGFEGTIDSDYRGEIKILLKDVPSNMSLVGERVAQLVVVPFIGTSVCTDDKPMDTARGTSGFGSTGRKP